MPRAKAILQSEYPYNISARSINREWFFIPLPRVWEIFCEELGRTSHDHKLLVHSFVLMSNHFHLIASTPEANISRCMHQFMGRTSRHYKCILQHTNYYLNAYKYNYRNPVSAGVCQNVQDYPYSTLRGVLNRSELFIPLAEDTTFVSDPNGTMEWLNKMPDAEKLEGFKWGLKHQFFTSKKSRRDNRPMITEMTCCNTK